MLGELSIDENQRTADGRTPRLVITCIGTLLLAAAAWFWLLPANEPVEVRIASARSADDQTMNNSNAVLEASGYVTARRQATVSSKYTGQVIDVFVEEGMVVEKNQLLAKLDDQTQRAQLALSEAQLNATASRLNEVRVQLQEAELAHDRTIELADKKLASEADLDSTRLAVSRLKARLESLASEIEVGEKSLAIQQQQLNDTEIRAPFAGVVIAKAAQPGEMISPVSAGGGFTRTGICTIVDMASLEIEVDVNESYINRVKPDQPATATLDSYEDWRIPAKVITIIPTADRNKATVRVRIAFLETDTRILPDMGVKVSFLEETEESTTQLTGVMISGTAIASIDDESVVFVVANDVVERRSVRVGPKQGSSRNIVSGLRAGEKVVTNLSDELIASLEDGQRVLAN
ncbi:MAG TPA: efflux RND transporter periplasmic adaptor subunit [Gammaproteobacteria bacterium]|nr:efflux RND transporter periplasmic adaptor subunit [Gammaproteobacteria bacterium]